MAWSDRFAAGFLGLTLGGCADDKGGQGRTDTVETGDALIDADGDGFFGDEDCNDSDAAIRPGITEICDGVDNDCDGEVDDGVQSTWYADADADGYGEASVTTAACSRPEGYVPGGTDCDDADGAVYPGAPEVCDGQDNDCDHELDEGLPEQDYDWWYADEDRDGYGDADAAVEACQQPEGYAANARDCDDADGTVYPGAPEVEGDGRLNDCDACWGDGLCDLEDAAARLYGVLENGQAGAALAGPGDIDGDGRPDAAVGAPSSSADGAERAGLVFLYAGRWVGDRSLLDSVATLLGPAETAAAGSALAGADLDGDGLGDLIVGAPGVDAPGANAGAAWLLFGGLGGELDLSAEEEIEAENAGDGVGGAVVAGGDADGDGVADLLVGAPRWPSLDDHGAVYLVSAAAGEGSLEEAAGRWSGEAHGDAAGSAIALGDLDGDGLDDLLVGAPEVDGEGRDVGALYVLSGVVPAWATLADADGLWRGSVANDAAGSALAAVDRDGDGLMDAMVGAPGRDDAGDGSGLVYALAGPAAGIGALEDGASGQIVGEDDGCGLGSALAAGGDVDGDGLGDLLLGEPGCRAGTPDYGTAAILLGPVTGAASLADLSVRWRGEAREDGAGTALAGLGDLDGDGLSDLLVGAPGSALGADGGGAAWLVLGVGL